MSRQPELYQWIDTVATRFPSLSKPQALGLALWSFGMILARSCSLAAVAGLLAPLLGQSFNSMRERLRDTYREAGAKAGGRRAELDVTLCWAPWLAWILDGRVGAQLAIAVDATSLGGLFVALAISVVYRGCAVPVAWKILKAGEKHAWKPEWQALLKQFRGLLPAGWTVIVLGRAGACTRGGCLRPSSDWGGIRSCASTGKACSVPRAGFTGGRYPVLCHPRASIGRGGERRSTARSHN